MVIGNVLRQRHDVGNADRDDVRRVKRAATHVARGGGTRHAHVVCCELVEQAPLPERAGPVGPRKNVGFTDELAEQASAPVVAQDELARNIADVHRVATTGGAQRPGQYLGMQPALRLEALVGNPVDDGLVVQDRTGRGLLDGFGHGTRSLNASRPRILPDFRRQSKPRGAPRRAGVRTPRIDRCGVGEITRRQKPIIIRDIAEKIVENNVNFAEKYSAR